MSRFGEPSSTLNAVRDLAADLAASADETEKERALPAQIVERLRRAGIFRMFVPKRYGGDALNEAQALAVIEELAFTDAAAAWTAMVAFGFNVIFARLPRSTVDKIYADGPDVLVRGALAPIGTAVVTDGGYVASGRWPFASGPYKPKWMVAGCVVIENGKPLMGPMGPETRVVLLPAEEVEFLDTWQSVGLRGSDSRDFQFKDVFIPEDYAMNAFNFAAPQVYGDPQFNLPFPMLNGPTHSAVCIGIVRASLQELGTLAQTKRSAFNPTQTLGESQIFQHRFGELVIRHAAIQALLEQQVRDLDSLIANPSQLSPLDMAKNGSCAGYIHAQAVDIVNEAFSLAGSTPVYTKSSLQRRWRDVRVAAQHFGGSTAQYPVLGALMAGQPMPGPAK